MDIIKTLQGRLQEESLDALLLYNFESSNRSGIAYVTGFSGSFGVAIVSNKGNFLITDSRYYTQAAQQSVFQLLKLESGRKAEDLAAEIFSRHGLKKIGFESDKITHARFLSFTEAARDIDFVESNSLVTDLRAVKSAEEIGRIKEAVRIAEESLNETLNVIKTGNSEVQVAATLEYEIRKRGGTAAFDTIVVSGERSALVHGTPSHRKINEGDFVLIDFGAKYFEYCSDITRTFCVGSPDSKMAKVYEVVYAAQKNARDSARAGVIGKDLHLVAQSVIEEAGYGEYFGHGLGHGLGMDVHEAPGASPNNDKALKQGNVITIEPGIYIPGEFGVRIEDDVVIQENGIELLTSFERGLMVL